MGCLGNILQQSRSARTARIEIYIKPGEADDDEVAVRKDRED